MKEQAPFTTLTTGPKNGVHFTGVVSRLDDVWSELYAPSRFILQSSRCLEPTAMAGRVYEVEDYGALPASLHGTVAD